MVTVIALAALAHSVSKYLTYWGEAGKAGEGIAGGVEEMERDKIVELL